MSDPGTESAALGGGLPDPNLQKISPGAQLTVYREERGWTIEQVASQLNLAPRQIAAIENDDYAALPGISIVRGFMRAYAKLLKVDAAPLLATLEGETVLVDESIAKALSTPFSETRLPSMMDHSGLPLKWIFGGLLVVLIVAGVWASQQGDLAAVSKSASREIKDSLASMSGADTNPQKPVTAGSGEINVAASPTTVGGATPDADAVSNEPSASSDQAIPQPGTAPVVEAPVPIGKNTLLIKMREDSWIEIRRSGGGGVLISRLAKAGESEMLEVTEPISLVIGNAAGVDATLRGESVEFKTNTSSNVARLKLQ